MFGLKKFRAKDFKMDFLSRSLWVVSLSFIFVTSQLSATHVLTIEAAIEEGLKQSPEIHRSIARVDESRWNRRAAFGEGFLPRLSVSAHHYFDVQYSTTDINFGAAPTTFPGFYPNTAASLDVMIPVFEGFAGYNRLRAASLIETASEQELSRAEFRLSADIRLAFYEALAATQLKQVSELNVKTLEEHLRQVKVQKAGGIATNYDSLRVEVQLNEANADAIDTEDNVILARKKLALLLGVENDERAIEGTLPIPDASKVKTLELKDVMPDRADLKALQARSEAVDKINSASVSWLMPTISVGGQYLFYDKQSVENSTVSNTGIFKNAYNVGVFLKWNIFDGGAAFAKSQAAAAQAVQAEKTSQIARLQVPFDFAYWKRRYLSNTDHYLSKKFDIARSEEAMRLAKEEERAGSRTSSERLDAELDLFKARAGVVKAQLNALEAQTKMELTLGRKL